MRSKSPDLVKQEIWGHLCCHYAIRTLMAEAAHRAGRDPDRISFVAALRIARRSVAQGAFPLRTLTGPRPSDDTRFSPLSGGSTRRAGVGQTRKSSNEKSRSGQPDASIMHTGRNPPTPPSHHSNP